MVGGGPIPARPLRITMAITVLTQYYHGEPWLEVNGLLKPSAKVPDGSAADMTKAIEAARTAFPSWSQTPLEERKALMQKTLASAYTAFCKNGRH